MPSTRVLLLRHRLEMRRLHAVTHPAQVIEDKSVRDNAAQKFVRHAVRGLRLAARKLYVSIAALIPIAMPEPATIGPLNTVPEAIDPVAINSGLAAHRDGSASHDCSLRMDAASV